VTIRRQASNSCRASKHYSTCLFRALHDSRLELPTSLRNFPSALPLTSSSRVPGEYRKAKYPWMEMWRIRQRGGFTWGSREMPLHLRSRHSKQISPSSGPMSPYCDSLAGGWSKRPGRSLLHLGFKLETSHSRSCVKRVTRYGDVMCRQQDVTRLMFLCSFRSQRYCSSCPWIVALSPTLG
jgi:hypothetical protein